MLTGHDAHRLGRYESQAAQLTQNWQGGSCVGALYFTVPEPGRRFSVHYRACASQFPVHYRACASGISVHNRRALSDPQVAKLAKDRLDDFDLAALGLARPAGGGGGGGSGARDDVPEHFYQCGLPPAVLQPACCRSAGCRISASALL